MVRVPENEWEREVTIRPNEGESVSKKIPKRFSKNIFLQTFDGKKKDLKEYVESVFLRNKFY